jgi:hypothetical protein
MGEPKPLASLSGLLLARKGAARPAMRRPSTTGNPDEAGTNQDDLGWNDMGYDVNPDPNAPMDYDHQQYGNPLAGAVPEVNSELREQQELIAQRLQAQAEVGFESLPATSLPADVQHVFEEIDEIEDDEQFDEAPRDVSDILSRKVTSVIAVDPIVAAPVVAAIAKPSARSVPRAARGSKGKAAFTLRLDKDRHLQLRLACAVSNRSAQMIVIEALDAYLNNMPEIGQLAASVPSK